MGGGGLFSSMLTVNLNKNKLIKKKDSSWNEIDFVCFSPKRNFGDFDNNFTKYRYNNEIPSFMTSNFESLIEFSHDILKLKLGKHMIRI